MRLLLVEDDPDALNILKVYFAAQGHEVIVARDGVQALEQFVAHPPDVVLLDVMLPQLDGWAVLEAIRARSDVPVILVTARDSTDDVIKGLELGGDDYLTKPFEPRELSARIEAVLRRVQERRGRRALGRGRDRDQDQDQDQDREILERGDLRIDDRAKAVTLSGRPVRLSPKEYELLKLLASDPGRVFSDEEIISHLWPPDSRATSNDVKQYIHLLRGKIEEDPQNPRRVLTVKGFGYKLETDEDDTR